MSLIDEARALLSVLQPLTGDRSRGTALVRSTAPTLTLPANAHAVPIVNGAIRHELLVKTALNPDNADGWPITGSGVGVPIISVIGGASMNLPAGTQLRWWPSVDGLEPVSSLSTEMAGGTAPTGIAGVQQLAFFEELQSAITTQGLDFAKAGITRFPAVMLVWDDFGPGDNQTVSPLTRGARAGRGKLIEKIDWSLYIVSSRADADPARRLEGLLILDEVATTLTDREFVDGISFSSPAGVYITGGERWSLQPHLYVYRLRIQTTGSRVLRDVRTFSPWLRTRLDAETATDPPLGIVTDNEFLMPQ